MTKIYIAACCTHDGNNIIGICDNPYAAANMADKYDAEYGGVAEVIAVPCTLRGSDFCPTKPYRLKDIERLAELLGEDDKRVRNGRESWERRNAPRPALRMGPNHRD